MAMQSLPILTLDERVLSPRFGYVFRAAWLEPYESIVGMLWKFVHANRLPGAAVVAQIGYGPVDAYEGVEPSRFKVNTRVVARLLGITHRRVLAGFVNPRGGADAGTSFRYCSRCLSAGYHGVVHQSSRHRVCLVHGCPLEQRCRSCQCSSSYRLDAQFLETPYRCRHCRRYFASCVPLPSARRRRLDLAARVCITRSMLT